MQVFQHSIHINATKEKIWNILIDVANWSQWDHDVQSAKLDRTFAVGATGILIAKDNTVSRFVITDIKPYNRYSNYYQLPLFTKLNFTHEIKSHDIGYKITFFAHFTGPFARYYAKKHGKTLLNVMKNAMKNLLIMCSH